MPERSTTTLVEMPFSSTSQLGKRSLLTKKVRKAKVPTQQLEAEDLCFCTSEAIRRSWPNQTAVEVGGGLHRPGLNNMLAAF